MKNDDRAAADPPRTDAATPAPPAPGAAVTAQVQAHPVGAVAGAVAGATAGALAGVAAGPVGSLVSAAAGAVAGGAMGIGAPGLRAGANPAAANTGIEAAASQPDAEVAADVEAGLAAEQAPAPSRRVPPPGVDTKAFRFGLQARDDLGPGALWSGAEPAVAARWRSERGPAAASWPAVRDDVHAGWDAGAPAVGRAVP